MADPERTMGETIRAKVYSPKSGKSYSDRVVTPGARRSTNIEDRRKDPGWSKPTHVKGRMAKGRGETSTKERVVNTINAGIRGAVARRKNKKTAEADVRKTTKENKAYQANRKETEAYREVGKQMKKNEAQARTASMRNGKKGK